MHPGVVGKPRQAPHVLALAVGLSSRRHGKERALLLYCLTAVLTVKGGDLCEAPVGADVFRNRLKGGTPGLLAPEVPEAGYLHSLIKFLLRSVWHRFDYKGTNN